jgi:hypothetical protein
LLSTPPQLGQVHGAGRRTELAHAAKHVGEIDHLEARGATDIIFGTSGSDVERELRAYAEVAGLR